MSDTDSHPGAIMEVCREYDNAAVVYMVDGKPEWRETPDRVHVLADLAGNEFLLAAYELSPGCHPEVLHGDLRTEAETRPTEEHR